MIVKKNHLLAARGLKVLDVRFEISEFCSKASARVKCGAHKWNMCSKQPQLSLLIKENGRLSVSLGSISVKKLRREFSRFCCEFLETFGFGFFYQKLLKLHFCAHSV